MSEYAGDRSATTAVNPVAEPGPSDDVEAPLTLDVERRLAALEKRDKEELQTAVASVFAQLSEVGSRMCPVCFPSLEESNG
jgi:hypothetical protein